MIETLAPEAAQAWFASLPPDRRIATLAPNYVVADAAREGGLTPCFAGYREGASFWLHGSLRGRVPGSAAWDLQSAYGYGGPVCNDDAADFLARAWAAYGTWARAQDILVEFVRLHPLAEGWQPYPGQVREDRATVFISLARPDFRAGYQVRCRTAVRKAGKAGLTVVEPPVSAIATHFPEFYREGMRQIDAEPFYLFGDAYFAGLASLPGIRLLACVRDGEWLAAGLFLLGGDSLEYHLSASLAAGRQLAAGNLLIDAAAALGQAAGATRLYLGGGTDSRPDNPLLFFKNGFSKERLMYRWGFQVHQPALYARLQEQYRATGRDTRRVLFYR